VRLAGAGISGPLDLGYATLVCPLSVHRCAVPSSITLVGADAPAVHVTSCALNSLDATQLRTRGDFSLAGSAAVGEVRLLGAHIGGQLDFRGVTLGGHSGPALIADGLQVDRHMFCRDGFDATGEVRLLGAHIGGELSFRGATLRNHSGPALNADRLQVDQSVFCDETFEATGEVRLGSAHIHGELSFKGATLHNDSGPALSADRLQVKQSVFCSERFEATGEVRLLAAHVGGQLSFMGATLHSDSTPALTADALQVDQGMVCRDGFKATGEVRLLGAHIGGQLDFTGATLRNETGPALNADRLQIRQNMVCRDGFKATGEVRLLGAHIGGELDFTGATLRNETGPALNADRLQIDQDMVCRDGFKATGRVRLLGAHIGGQLDFTGATLNASGIVLDLEDATARMLLLRFAGRPSGPVDLRLARFERFADQNYGPGPDHGWAPCLLLGCRYDILSATPEPLVGSRLHWLAADPQGYAPQPYEELADAYRHSGDEAAARKVLIAKQARRRTETLAWPAKGWSWFLGATVGYGYRLHYAGLWLIALAISGSLLFAVVFQATTTPGGDLTPAKTARQSPSFQPALYTIDVLLPVVSLGQDTGWNAHGAAQWITPSGTLLGWLLTTALAAGLVTRRT
jgi:hypothetical protein